jgi:hypothetical protein
MLHPAPLIGRSLVQFVASGGRYDEEYDATAAMVRKTLRQDPGFFYVKTQNGLQLRVLFCGAADVLTTCAESLA